MSYKGKYKVKNPQKYKGSYESVTYRSLWERAVFKWLDACPDVLLWNSEEIIIPYRCKTDGKMHRYFVDLYVKFKNGKEFIVEIKPAKETVEPKKRVKMTRKYITEVMTWAKNSSKWAAAEKWAAANNMEFQTWTEHTIRGLGIRLL